MGGVNRLVVSGWICLELSVATWGQWVYFCTPPPPPPLYEQGNYVGVLSFLWPLGVSGCISAPLLYEQGNYVGV